MPTRLSVLTVLLLSALLLAAGAAHGVQAEPVDALALEEPFEGEAEEDWEEELEDETCEEAEVEFELGEIDKAEADAICAEEDAGGKKSAGRSSATPEECVLRSAHAHAAVNDEKLKLTVGYTAYKPIAAKLKIGHLATIHRQLGRSGVIRLVKGLHGGNAPRRLNIRIDIPSVKRAGCPSRRLVLFPR